MNKVMAFQDIENLRSVAEDFSLLLSRGDNTDIAIDFPGTMRRYTGDTSNVHNELLKTKEHCRPGIREQFIVFAGEIAVGLSAIQLVDEPPEGIDAEIPNLSGLIANPWRSLGLGKLSLRHRLDIADNRFNSQAYSLVRKNNAISQKLVESNGLKIVGEDESHFVYLYRGADQ
jgi:hypothetical protein